MKIEVKRNYLSISKISDLIEQSAPSIHCKVELLNPPNFHINKFFYKQIGKKHRWIDRLAWEDEKWMKYLNNSNIKTFILKEKDDLIGYFEQIYNKNKSNCEIAYFGILENFFGKKYGGYLLSEAIKISLDQNINKLWVHTCSLDHKNALKNYLSRGMKIYKSEKINLEID